MKKSEKIAWIITGIEFVMMFAGAVMVKKAADHKAQTYGCKDSNDYIDKALNGQIKMPKRN